jgi:S1-C subfamily serine protease
MKAALAVLLFTLTVAAAARPGWLGIAYTVHSESGSGWLYIRGIAPKSPAERADLRPGDLVIAIDGRPVRFQQDVDVLRYLATIRPDQSIALTIIREQKQRVIHAIAAQMSAETYERWKYNFELATKKRRH